MQTACDVVNTAHQSSYGLPLLTVALCVTFMIGTAATATAPIDASNEAVRAKLGESLFNDSRLSSDHKTSCASCHDPAHAYADPHSRSIGVDRKIGTRNAPSLIGISDDASFTWDGRRERLEDVVLDPFTNPVELGLSSSDEVVQRIAAEPDKAAALAAAFPGAKMSPTIDQVGAALASFVRSLNVHGNVGVTKAPLSAEAELGRKLFDGVARCNECHTHSDASARFSDGHYHHSGIGDATESKQLPTLVQAVMQRNLKVGEIGPKVLSDADWSSLGRFVVSHKPVDIGAFRTPSLRNVAVTAPYMHDGSIATLAEAVDHEIYYRGFSSEHPINLTQRERQALVKFLQALTDEPLLAKTP